MPFKIPDTGNYPWVDAEYSFVGWVPNVSGHLSFGLICADGQLDAFNRRHPITGERAVAIHRKRSAQDFPLPGRLVGLFRRSATLDYVVVGRTAVANTPHWQNDQIEEKIEENGVLIGSVLVVPRDSDKATKSIRGKFLQSIDTAIAEAQTVEHDKVSDTFASLPENILDYATKAQNQILCHIVNFALFRTGELRVWFDLSEFLGRDVSAKKANDSELFAAEHLPSQIYYCLKDLTHRHYHHDPETDQLIDLHRVSSDCPSSEHLALMAA